MNMSTYCENVDTSLFQAVSLLWEQHQVHPCKIKKVQNEVQIEVLHPPIKRQTAVIKRFLNPLIKLH